MMRILKYGRFSSFTTGKGKAAYVLLAQNVPYCAYYYYSFTVPDIQTHLAISWISRPGTGCPSVR